MSNIDFSNAKVGDKVWDVRKGYGIIEEIDNTEYPIIVRFVNSRHGYTISGLYYDYQEERSLFWDKPKFEIPERSKQKKILKGWIGIGIIPRTMCTKGIIGSATPYVFESKEILEDFFKTRYINSLLPFSINLEYEE